ncbi:MAG TPA: cytochrome c, partial [Polyangiaceae bacterium]|nr:cytochrome c [Polyangiaceae bacterium]
GTPPDVGVLSPAVAFRGVGLPNGMMLLAHQVESGAPLGTGLGAYYGGNCAGGGVVQQVLSLVSVDGSALPSSTDSPSLGTLFSTAPTAPLAVASRVVVGAVGPIDLAVSRDGTRVAVVASGNSWYVTSKSPSLFVDSLDVSAGGPPASLAGNSCNGSASIALSVEGEPVAVAFDAAGKYVVQSREPATLRFESGATVALSAESHYDTGFAMFHLNTGGGIACSSCHPEAGDDGHIWSFSAVGLRRSQALEGGVGERAPFHWSGDLPTFDDLFGEVMLKRMALPVVPPEGDVQALLGWLDTVPALEPADGLDAALVVRGRTLFMSKDLACGTCHSGPDGSDHQKHDVGTGGVFVTPALLGVGLRAPLMHDGCARTLRDRFGLCGGSDHGNVKNLPAADIDALVAFLQSL